MAAASRSHWSSHGPTSAAIAGSRPSRQPAWRNVASRSSPSSAAVAQATSSGSGSGSATHDRHARASGSSPGTPRTTSSQSAWRSGPLVGAPVPEPLGLRQPDLAGLDVFHDVDEDPSPLADQRRVAPRVRAEVQHVGHAQVVHREVLAERDPAVQRRLELVAARRQRGSG